MNGKPLALALTLAAAVLAGCSSQPAATPNAAWQLDCSMGLAERAHAPWAQDCEARASHTPGQKQEVWLAANPHNPDNVVIGAKDLNPDASANCVWNGLFVTHDGGATWKDVLIGGSYAQRQQDPTNPYYGYACNTDPMGVFTSDGVLHWVVELYNAGGTNGFGPLPPLPPPVSNNRGIVQPGWKLVLAESDDGGDTFPLAKAVTLEYGDGVAILNDYSRVTESPTTNTVIPVINTYYPATGANAVANPAAGVVCSVLPYRGNGAAVQPVPVQPTVQTGQANPGGFNCNGIAAKYDGTIVLAALGYSSPVPGMGTSGAFFAQSKDDAATFSDFTFGFTYHGIPSPFNESMYRTGTNFELAYDNSNATTRGTLYAITAEDLRGGDGSLKGDDADIVVRASRDDGATWASPVKVNHDNTTSHQFEPNIVVAADGSVHAFWMDKAYDLARHHDNVTNQDCGPHCFIDVTHAVSVDGGRTWRTERVTQVSFNGDLGKHQEGFPFIGDYTGIGASGNTVWAGFPDASNGKTTVIAAIKVVNPSLPKMAGHVHPA
ncbi:MAG: sialidase family protein [Thermoplasmatota archaeon]